MLGRNQAGAFSLWLLASLLMTIHAVLLPATVFVVLGAIQIGAITIILVYSARYRGLVYPTHAQNLASESL
jgi:hypothetical protein